MDNSLKQCLQDEYRMEDPTIVARIDSGYMAESLVVADASTKFFVKKYHAKRPSERLLEIHQVKKFFQEHGVSTITPLLNTHGTTLSPVDDTFLAVFPFITDRQYYAVPGDKAVAAAGRNLARLHLVSADHLSLVQHRQFEPWDKEKFLAQAEPWLELATAGTAAFDSTAAEMLTLKLQLARQPQTPFEALGLKNDAILHGDYHTHNLFFDDQDNVSYTYDFERTMAGPRTTDLAYGLFMICFDLNTDIENDVSPVHFERARSFVQSYHETYPISTEEFINGVRWFFLDKMVYLGWPFTVHYGDGDTRADKLLPKRLNRLKYFSEHLDETIDTFRGFIQ